MLGNLVGLSDREAYRTVGMYMQEHNMFKGQQQAPAKQPVPATPLQSKTTNQNPKLKQRKKAAGSTKTTPVSGSKKDFNPLDLSDEEFAKLSDPKI